MKSTDVIFVFFLYFEFHSSLLGDKKTALENTWEFILLILQPISENETCNVVEF